MAKTGKQLLADAMDKIATYRKYMQQLITEKANRSNQNPSQVEAQTIFDTERDHYQLVYVGWKRNGLRDYGCLLHLDIKDDKIWIQYDGTEGGFAYKLVELGVPEKDIVLGYQPIEIRPHTEFAVSQHNRLTINMGHSAKLSAPRGMKSISVYATAPADSASTADAAIGWGLTPVFF